MKPITEGSFNDSRATAKLVGGQEGYAVKMFAWRMRKADENGEDCLCDQHHAETCRFAPPKA